MTALRNTELELSKFRLRVAVAVSVVIMTFGLLAGRLAWMQIIKHEGYLDDAEKNRITHVPLTPSRGLITDRNGVVLARNYSAYTLEITPNKTQDIEALINELSTFIEITAKDRHRFKKLAKDSKLTSFPIRTRLTDEEVARFTAQRYRFPAVEVQARLFRQYPMAEAGSHLLGYIGRISEDDAKDIKDSDDPDNYLGTEYIGKEGLEKRYESVLHGTTGIEEVEVNAIRKPIRTLSHSTSLPGDNLVLSIDIELQKAIEGWYGDNRGALVALDPETGEVLAMVSKPNYDPNLFVEGIDVDNWKALNESLDKPLLNRPLAGLYPPGSTYKPFMALAALTLGKRTPEQSIADPGYFWSGTHQFRDDKAGGHGIVNMYRSIVESCNTYYYTLANDLGVDTIHDFMKPLGFGQLTGIDLDGERAGILPSTEWKRTTYKTAEQQKWYPGETISIGIGQGYNSFTMMQLAQATATLANQGIQSKPHLVTATENSQTGARTPVELPAKVNFKFNPQHLEVIKNALIGVNIEGTSSGAFRGASYQAAGKTGTAQAIGIKKDERYNASRIAERYRDHALYMAFAPADKPKIALAMIVENAGFGAQSAAPIARKIFDYWLLGKRESTDALAAALAATVAAKEATNTTNTAKTAAATVTTVTTPRVDTRITPVAPATLTLKPVPKVKKP